MDMETHAGNMVLIIKFIWIFYVECQFSFIIINSSSSSVCSNLTLTGRITSVLLLLPHSMICPSARDLSPSMVFKKHRITSKMGLPIAA